MYINNMRIVSQLQAVNWYQFASNLLAGVRHPFSSPNDALCAGIMPRNFTYSFQLSIKTFLHAYNAPNVCALAFSNMAEIAVKWGILLVRNNSIFGVPNG
jgi:hypothetical protein